MVWIELTEKQISDLQPEISRCEVADTNERAGMLILQVWFKDRMAMGGFIPNEPATKIAEIAQEYRI